jgi:hypothetical protein
MSPSRCPGGTADEAVSMAAAARAADTAFALARRARDGQPLARHEPGDGGHDVGPGEARVEPVPQPRLAFGGGDDAELQRSRRRLDLAGRAGRRRSERVRPPRGRAGHVPVHGRPERTWKKALGFGRQQAVEEPVAGLRAVRLLELQADVAERGPAVRLEPRLDGQREGGQLGRARLDRRGTSGHRADGRRQGTNDCARERGRRPGGAERPRETTDEEGDGHGDPDGLDRCLGAFLEHEASLAAAPVTAPRAFAPGRSAIVTGSARGVPGPCPPRSGW